ncbi:MAG: CPBP family intramembrane glutamic endopeptidase [Candidatus Bathyarchaeia archaeon]
MKELGVYFAEPRKDAYISIGFVMLIWVSVTGVFYLLGQVPGGQEALRPTTEFRLSNSVFQWFKYALLSIIPISLILRARGQSLDSVGLTQRNAGTSVGIGLLLSALLVSIVIWDLSAERFVQVLLSSASFYAFIYYLAVGLGEELMFRGFLQLRCSIWLGEIRGWLLASVIMALIHLPQRIFVMRLELFQALGSALSLIPVSLLFGFIFLRTRNILGPALLHDVFDWVSIF